MRTDGIVLLLVVYERKFRVAFNKLIRTLVYLHCVSLLARCLMHTLVVFAHM